MVGYTVKNIQSSPSPYHRTARLATPLKASKAGHSTSNTSQKCSRGVLILPGLGNNSKDYLQLVEVLKKRDVVAEVVQVSRADWLRNAAGLTDVNYWRGTLNPRPTVDWYLNKVDNGVKQTAQQVDGSIALLGHSAGGWLARLYLLGFGSQGIIDKLVTLGSPHMPPPEGSKVVDQTRGILTHIEENCPGRFHEEVAGRYIKGASFSDKRSTWKEKIVGLGYQQVCGRADVWGDGVVPEPAAHLPGALQITLENVYHSPVGSRSNTNSKSTRLWYGSEQVVDQWVESLIQVVDSGQSGLLSLEDVIEQSVN